MDRKADSHSHKADAYSAAVKQSTSSYKAYTNALVNMIPPLIVAAVVLGWMLAPREGAENPLPVIIAGFVTSFALLGLEKLFEVGNSIELVLISLSVVALFCALNVMGVISGFAHANILPDPTIFYSCIFRHHSLYHTALSYEERRYNYGNSLTLMDRIVGTYREGESSIVGQDGRKWLSIREQFTFPFRPVFDKLKKISGAGAGTAKGER